VDDVDRREEWSDEPADGDRGRSFRSETRMGNAVGAEDADARTKGLKSRRLRLAPGRRGERARMRCGGRTGRGSTSKGCGIGRGESGSSGVTGSRRFTKKKRKKKSARTNAAEG
jgi:hypothetical protein